jgi:type IV pilus assembly protein PilY1
VPSVAGVATKPNVMLVMDYSGSMQFRAHYRAHGNNPWGGYYGNNVAYDYQCVENTPPNAWASGRNYNTNNVVSNRGNYYICTYNHTSGSSTEPGVGANWTTRWISAETTKASLPYEPTRTYFGIFQSNVYYTYDTANKYWVPAATQPVTAYVFTDKSSGGGPVAAWATATAYVVNNLVSDSGKSYMCTTAHTSAASSKPGSGASWTTYWILVGTGTELVQFTAAGHNLQVGQLVEFQGLTSHTGMNGNAFYVTAVAGDTFKVAYPWNGNPDAVVGSVQRRVPGTLLTTYLGVAQTPGLSGNILNYASASRVDASLQALIGGPGTCDTNYCYIKGQGERSYVRESANLQGEFYVRMAGNDSTAVYPNNYDTGTYTSMTSYVSLSGRYSGNVTTADNYTGTGASKYYYEAWKFTTTGPTHIDVTLTGSWSAGTESYVAIFNSTNFTGSAVASASGNPATLSTDLSTAGTYYLLVRANALNATGTYTLTSSQELSGYDSRNTSNPSVSPGTFNGQRLLPPGFTTPIGSIPQAQVKVRINKADRTGVVQQTFNQVRYGFMYYNATAANVGKILVGCHNTDLNTLLNAFTTIYPYNGTPTGQALEEAYDYFKQANDHGSNADNSSFISPTTDKDPYYQKTLATPVTYVAVPCRKSYVVLLSDGAWNEDDAGASVDPIIPARAMHTENLRPSISPTEKISVDVYSIFAFGTESEAGRNAMKAIGAFGGFKDDSSYGTTDFPYNFSSVTPAAEYTPTNCEAPCEGSKTLRWPRSYCDPTVPLPAGHTYDDGCKEWDQSWDKYTSGDGLDKGVPDNYFECSEGQDLQAALLKVLSGAIVKNATASAVATVAQQAQEGDIIVRGLFHAADPDTVGRYLWRGHLEAYWPAFNESTFVWEYDFEKPDSKPCFEMTGDKHCWDAAEILQSRSTNDRTIYTWDPGTKTRLTLPTTPRDTSAPFNFSPPWDATTNTTWQTKLGLTGTPTAEGLTDWVRGNDAVTEAGFDFRDREKWMLGDMIYSTPVVVGTPVVGAVSTRDPNRDEFYQYRNHDVSDTDTVYYRDKVIYVGANDGMIHAFLMAKWDSAKKIWLTKPGTASSNPVDPTYASHPDIGKELWAYIPSNLLTELQYLAKDSYGAGGCVHRTMVDLAPQSYEVYIKSSACAGTERCWRTVILGGERGGGDVYFAIDVTDPNNPTVLWEYSLLKNRVVYDRSGTRSATNCATTPNDANCKAANMNTAYLFTDSTTYEKLKVLPVAWSRPAVGRLRIPTAVDVYKLPTSTTAGLTVPTGLTNWVATDWDDKSSWTINPDNSGYHQPRHVAFIGGAVRIFQDDTSILKDPSLTATTDPLSAAYRFDLFRPEFMAIDIETGTNLLTYYWPKIQDQTAFRNLNSTVDRFYELFPVIKYGANYIPYSMADPLAVDVRRSDAHSVGDDGYVDAVYVGDLLGNFYGLKFNFDKDAIDSSSGNVVATPAYGIRVDWWRTKETYEGIPATKTNVNYYRGPRQPITVPPVASLNSQDTDFLHVIFGTGKFEDIPISETPNDDMRDTARASIYNLKDLVQHPRTDFFSNNAKTVGNFKIEVNPRCPAQESTTTCGSVHTIRNWPKSGDTPCVWIKDDLVTHDCGETNCPQPAKPSNACVDPCWNCIYDLTSPADLLSAGERVVRKALIAGGLLFFTTNTPPSTQCESQGSSKLYVLSYNCDVIPGSKSIFMDASLHAIGLKTGSVNAYDPRGWVVDLGAGVASNPVLDSTNNVVIQMSNGDLKRIQIYYPLKIKGFWER